MPFGEKANKKTCRDGNLIINRELALKLALRALSCAPWPRGARGEGEGKIEAVKETAIGHWLFDLESQGCIAHARFSSRLDKGRG